MNEGGDGFDEALGWTWTSAIGVGLLRLLGGVEKVFERLRAILSSGDAFVGVLAAYDFNATARGMEEGVGGVSLRSDELGVTNVVEIPAGLCGGVTGGAAFRSNLNGVTGASSSSLGEKIRGDVNLGSGGVASSEEVSESSGGEKVKMIPPSTISPPKSSS